MPVPWSKDERERSRSPRSKSYEEIVQIVVMREQARQTKDWALADTYRTQLQQMGVTLFDKTNSWRSTDGLTGRIPSWADLEAGETPEAISSQLTQMMPSSTGEGTSIDEAKVKELVLQREQARSNKDFARSDEIRDELKALGVEVYDKEKMWRAKCGASGCILGFRGANGPTDLEITTLVVQREKARQSGDWASSDMIRDELRAVGVEIYDKDKIWKANDGRQAAVPSWSQIQSGTAVIGPVSKGGAGLSQQQLQALLMPLANSGEGGGVQSQVLAAAIMAAQNPATAARTLQMLQTGGGMAELREQSQEVSEAMQFIDDIQATGRTATDAEINWLVGIREKARQSKDFSSADEMRTALTNTLGVTLQEKEKKWETNDGRHGCIPMWNDM